MRRKASTIGCGTIAEMDKRPKMGSRIVRARSVEAVDDKGRSYSFGSMEAPTVEPHETFGIAPYAPKTAALLFDRVFTIGTDETHEYARDMVFRHVPGFDEQEERAALRGLSMMRDAAGEAERRVAGERYYFMSARRSFERHFQCGVPFLFDSRDACASTYEGDDRACLTAAIQQLRILDETATEWTQIREFRRDAAAKTDYRRLVRWLNRDMQGWSPVAVAEELALRLEDYERAIDKHGLATRVGLLSTTMDFQSLTAVFGSLGASTLLGEPFAGALAATGLLSARALVKVAESKVARAEVDSAHREIAFVAEVANRFRPDPS